MPRNNPCRHFCWGLSLSLSAACAQITSPPASVPILSAGSSATHVSAAQAEPRKELQLGTSVAELIESMKLQREMALGQPLGRSIGGLNRPRAAARAKPESSGAPLVWSISGLNDDYSAVLVIDQQVHTVSSRSLPQSVTGWLVVSLNAQGVCMSRLKRSMCLPAPDSASSVQPFVRALAPHTANRALAPMLPAQDQDLGGPVIPADTLPQALAAQLPILPGVAGGGER